MTQKNRLIILTICAALFLFFTPMIVFYSLGYRYDFKKNKTVATGGIYVKAMPLGSEITVDQDSAQKTGIFTTYVFVQNLLPSIHSVSIKKDGYFDYQKNLMVKENEVTKLEHITLFKKDIAFTALAKDATSPFETIAKPASYTLKNSNLYQAKDQVPMVKNVLAFNDKNSLLYLAGDGFLYRANYNGENSQAINTEPLKITKKNTYEIWVFGDYTFVRENNSLLMLDSQSKTFKPFGSDILAMNIAPDNQKMAYWTQNTISIYYREQNNDSYDHVQNTPLPALPEAITNVFWINNDYLLAVGANHLFIIEIDARQNVNIITLGDIISPTTPKPVDLSKASVIFNDSDKKIYLKTDTETIASERLIP